MKEACKTLKRIFTKCPIKLTKLCITKSLGISKTKYYVDVLSIYSDKVRKLGEAYVREEASSLTFIHEGTKTQML